MRFMHIADVHLGYQQYGLKERFDDFSKVFLHLIDEAVDQEVDFVLLAGDLFEKRAVEPLAMRVAIAGLQTLKKAGVPVLAVEGNHEKAYYREQTSWMDFLDALGYLRLLNPRFEGGRAVLEPHGADGGAYVDLAGGVRVYGLRYYGASMAKALQSVTEALANHDDAVVHYTILMLHAGLEGQLAHIGRLKYRDIAPLRDRVDYVALGHIHKPYRVEDWIYNPGSPETCGIDETAWPQRGCYLVDITPDHNPRHRAKLVVPPRRPFHRLRLEVDAATEPSAVYDTVRALIRRERAHIDDTSKPVVELTLSGTLPFNRYDLDVAHIQDLLETAWQPLTARVRNLTMPTEFEVRFDEESSRPELERAILRDLLERDVRYRDDAEAWTEGALALKQLVLERGAPEAVVDHLRQLSSELPSGPGSSEDAGLAEGESI